MYPVRAVTLAVILLCLSLAMVSMPPAAENGAPAGERMVELSFEPLDSAALPNGEWWIFRGTPDRTLLLESRRLPVREYGEEAVRRLVMTEWQEARELTIGAFPALTEKTGRPVLKAEFLYGENEDTRLFAAALVFAEDWCFWYVLQVSDHADLVADAAGTDAPPLKTALESLLLEVEAAEPAEGDLPAGSPVHLSGGASSLRIDVMDALVRIKKIVDPDHSPWVGAGRTAYRYDGAGTVSGTPALLFSFGADSREKFTAERHFAVDEEGTVYEMDVEAGGAYWKWEERGAAWWGEYRRGEAVLRIGNYREGPYGMYFTFDFAIGDETVSDGVALVRGRAARYDQLVFILAEDDGAVTVMAEAGSNGEPGDPWRLEGFYGRE